MRPLGWVGVVLIVGGGIVLAMRGVSYTKSRNDVDVGPLRLSTSEKGFVPPVVGIIAICLGAGILFMGRRQQ